MLAAFIGIAYWERPTLLVASEYTPAEIAAQNAKYQDYIASFQNGDGGKWVDAPRAPAQKGSAVQADGRPQPPKGPMSEASATASTSTWTNAARSSHA